MFIYSIVYATTTLVAIIAALTAFYRGKKSLNFYTVWRQHAIPVALFSLIISVLFSIPDTSNSPARIIYVGSVGVMVLASLFEIMFNKFQFQWLKIFFFIGLACTLGAATSITVYDTYTNLWTATIGIAFLEGIGSGLVFAWASLIYFIQSRHHLPVAHPVSTDKVTHYRNEGLSDEEIHFFREQMGVAKQQILNIETQINKTAKLKAIAIRFDLLKVVQSFFKDIVQQPRDFNNANVFLYKLLPSLEDLLNKYNEINGHAAKNKQTYLILEKSAATIEQLCQQIIDEYVRFHQSDYNDLMDEIELAERTLTRNTSTAKSDEAVDSVTALINEDLQKENSHD